MIRRPIPPVPAAGSTERPPPLLPKNYLGPCILLLLRERRAHGYELLARLPGVGLTRPQRNGRYADSGAVYRTLHQFEEHGLVCSDQEGSTGTAPRRIYELTPAGREELHRRVHVLMDMSDQVGAFESRYQRSLPSRSTVPPSRRLPSRVAQTVLRRPLGGLNPLRRR